MRYVLRFLGFPIWVLDVVPLEFEDGEAATNIGGGSCHDFERDGTPLSPDDRYAWEWEDKNKFGFGGSK